jgi:hypothetical protein
MHKYTQTTPFKSRRLAVLTRCNRDQGRLEMADIASETALQHLESLYPHGEITSSLDGDPYKPVMSISTQSDFLVIKNPWYLPTLASFAAGNRPEAVPRLFKYVLGGLEQAQNRFSTPVLEANHEKFLLAHRFRDAIFKGGIIGGYSRVYPCYLG